MSTLAEIAQSYADDAEKLDQLKNDDAMLEGYANSFRAIADDVSFYAEHGFDEKCVQFHDAQAVAAFESRRHSHDWMIHTAVLDALRKTTGKEKRA